MTKIRAILVGFFLSFTCGATADEVGNSNPYSAKLKEFAAQIEAEHSYLRTHLPEIEKKVYEVLKLSMDKSRLKTDFRSKPEDKRDSISFSEDTEKIRSKQSKILLELVQNGPIISSISFSNFQKSFEDGAEKGSNEEQTSDELAKLIMGRARQVLQEIAGSDIQLAHIQITEGDQEGFPIKCLDPSIISTVDCANLVVNLCSKSLSVGSSAGFLQKETIGKKGAIETTVLQTVGEVEKYVESKYSGSENSLGRTVFLPGVTAALMGCGYLAHEGKTWAQKEIRYLTSIPWNERAGSTYFPSIFSEGDFLNNCSPRRNQDVQRLEKLANHERVDSFVKRKITDFLKRREKNCPQFVQLFCQHHEVLRGQNVALNYPTQGCNIRSVLKEDIHNDVKRWELQNVGTKADQLKHLELADQIELCERALRDGYSWNFSSPTISTDCEK